MNDTSTATPEVAGQVDPTVKYVMEATGDVASSLSEGLSTALSKVTDVLTAHAPDAFQALVNVYHFKAFAGVFTALMWLSVSIFLMFLTQRFHKAYIETSREDAGFLAFASGTVSVTSFVGFMITLEAYQVVGLFAPEWYMYASMVDKVMQ